MTYHRRRRPRDNRGVTPIDTSVFVPPKTIDTEEPEELEKKLDLLVLDADSVTVAVPVTEDGRRFLNRYVYIVDFILECRHKNQIWYLKPGAVDAVSISNAATEIGLMVQIVLAEDLEEIVEGCGCTLGSYRKVRNNPDPARRAEAEARFLRARITHRF